MSRIAFKFIQSIATAVTPVFNATLQVGDKITDVFAKLQGLLSRRSVITSRISLFQGGTSTTADVVINTLVIPAGYVTPGDFVDVEFYGSVNKSNASTVSFWIKVGATKSGGCTYSTTGTLTGTFFTYRARIVYRGAGAAAAYVAAGELGGSPTTAGIKIVNGGQTGTIDTTNDHTITFGINYSHSNGGNRVDANVAILELR